jgi:hypothetical protein
VRFLPGNCRSCHLLRDLPLFVAQPGERSVCGFPDQPWKGWAARFVHEIAGLHRGQPCRQPASRSCPCPAGVTVHHRCKCCARSPVSVSLTAVSWGASNAVPDLKHCAIPLPCSFLSNPIYRTQRPRIDINGQGRPKDPSTAELLAGRTSLQRSARDGTN